MCTTFNKRINVFNNQDENETLAYVTIYTVISLPFDVMCGVMPSCEQVEGEMKTATNKGIRVAS